MRNLPPLSLKKKIVTDSFIGFYVNQLLELAFDFLPRESFFPHQHRPSGVSSSFVSEKF
jgi:hypothetical protein